MKWYPSWPAYTWSFLTKKIVTFQPSSFNVSLQLNKHSFFNFLYIYIVGRCKVWMRPASINTKNIVILSINLSVTRAQPVMASPESPSQGLYPLKPSIAALEISFEIHLSYPLPLMDVSKWNSSTLVQIKAPRIVFKSVISRPIETNRYGLICFSQHVTFSCSTKSVF